MTEVYFTRDELIHTTSTTQLRWDPKTMKHLYILKKGDALYYKVSVSYYGKPPFTSARKQGFYLDVNYWNRVTTSAYGKGKFLEVTTRYSRKKHEALHCEFTIENDEVMSMINTIEGERQTRIAAGQEKA